jgi:hypothetical protein
MARTVQHCTPTNDTGLTHMGAGPPRRARARAAAAPRPSSPPPAAPRVRLHFRFRHRGTEYVNAYGMKWMSGGAELRCDRALAAPPPRAPAPRPPPVAEWRHVSLSANSDTWRAKPLRTIAVGTPASVSSCGCGAVAGFTVSRACWPVPASGDFGRGHPRRGRGQQRGSSAVWPYSATEVEPRVAQG